jgi:hypothetical protein
MDIHHRATQRASHDLPHPTKVVPFGTEMPYEFTEWEHVPEPKASSSRMGGPPRKVTGIGILDPPLPPKRQSPFLPLAGPFLARVFAAIILLGIVGAVFLLLLPHH